jgi:prepilin-type N-terminal cleavage/methylation domain-containing protein
MKQHSRTGRAFTLIEMLAVIGIIALLVALLFPAIKNSLLKGEYIRAQSGISSLSTAFKAYYTEYGKWPITDTGTLDTYIIDQNFVALLEGGPNPVTPPNATGFMTDPPFGNPAAIGNATLNGNPRGIHFLDFKAADLGTVGALMGVFIDPWKQPYYVRFDVTYINAVPDPFTSAPRTNLSGGFLIWSAGPDNQCDDKGDALPAYTISPLNKDNVTSWW